MLNIDLALKTNIGVVKQRLDRLERLGNNETDELETDELKKTKNRMFLYAYVWTTLRDNGFYDIELAKLLNKFDDLIDDRISEIELGNLNKLSCSQRRLSDTTSSDCEANEKGKNIRRYTVSVVSVGLLIVVAGAIGVFVFFRIRATRRDADEIVYTPSTEWRELEELRLKKEDLDRKRNQDAEVAPASDDPGHEDRDAEV